MDARLISRKLKIRLYKALIVPIALYGAETWSTTITKTNAVKVFEMKCLKAILSVTMRDRTRNEDIRAILGVTEIIEDTLNARRLRWFGNVVRSAETNLIKAGYTQNFEGRQRRGRPRKRWSDNIRVLCGIPLATAERRASNRDTWREDVVRWVARGDKPVSEVSQDSHSTSSCIILVTCFVIII